MQVVSTRQWEKDRLADTVAEVIKRFSSGLSDQVNLAAPSVQKMLAIAVIEKLEEDRHLS